jgi:hypothetical protein
MGLDPTIKMYRNNYGKKYSLDRIYLINLKKYYGVFMALKELEYKSVKETVTCRPIAK